VLLEGSEGQSLELCIIGYQFPENHTDDYDSNWLTVQGRVVHQLGRWRFQDPCLLTYEAQRLADWLDSAASGTPSESQMDFIEPNLVFRWVESPAGSYVRVYFEVEARPPWLPPSAAIAQDCWMDFPASPSGLRHAAMALRDNLTGYPQRAQR
jgi:hypothetical protein